MPPDLRVATLISLADRAGVQIAWWRPVLGG